MRAALAPFRHAWPHLWRQRGPLALGIGCILPATAIDLSIPWLWKRAIDGAIGGSAAPRALAGLAAGAVALGLVAGALKWAMRRLLVGASRDFERDLRLALHARLLALPARWHARTSVGDLASRLSQDVEAVRMTLGPGVMYVVSALVTVGAVAIALLLVDPGLAGWMGLALLALSGGALLIAPRLGRASDAVQEGIAAISSASTESFAGIRVLKAFCGEERAASRMQQLSRRYFEAQMELARARGGMMSLLFLAKDTLLFVILLVGGLAITRGRATVGDLVLFRDWMLACFWPLVTFGWMVSMVQRAAAGMRRLAEILEAPPLPQPEAPQEPPAGPLALEWRDVTVEAGGRRLLDGVTLKVPAGRSLGITGRTGAGKSTLALLAARLHDVDAGEVRVGGIDVRRQALDRLRRRVAVVPQESFLFSDTLAENVRFARPDASDAQAIAALADAGFDVRDEALPDGIATRVGERGVTLSGGQRQRATLARALLAESDLLVVDDACSAVDAQTEARILERLGAAARGRTLVVVSHRVAALEGLDEVAVLEGGRVVEAGPPARLLAADGPFARLAQAQRLEQELESL